MDFLEIARIRQSCRSYDETRPVEEEKLLSVLEAARLAPSACNGQPYHFTVCRGQAARDVAQATMGRGMNKFAAQAPVMIVMSEMPYVRSAEVGAKIKGNDYRSMDIGIACAYLTAQAAALGLGTCILGWFDDDRIRGICGLDYPVRLVIALGYPAPGDSLRDKKRKALSDLVSFVEDKAVKAGTEEWEITRGKPDDLDDVFALYRSLKGEPYGTWNDEYPTRELIRNDLEQDIVLLLREGGRIVSAIVILEDDEFDMFPGWYPDVKRFCEFARLGVAKDKQGQGIARRMLLAAEEAAKAAGFDAVRFLVGASNLPAQRSYAKLGYDVLPETVEAWGETWLRYQKKL